MRGKPSRRIPLQFEQLEGRLPLAGNVAVAVSGADLKITGDDLENAISITLDEPNNRWIVTGVNDAAGTDTTVNGGAAFNATIPATGFRNVTIDMKKANTPAGNARGLLGADSVEMIDLGMSGALTIKGKNGGIIALDDLDVVGKTTITFGNGLRAASLGSKVQIKDSTLGPALTQGGKGKDLAITTGINNDDVLITDTSIGGNVTISTKDGNNTVAFLGTRSDPVPDAFESSTTVGGSVTVTTGSGNDAVGFLGAVINKNLKIGTGKGNDFAGAADMAVRGTTSVTSTDGDDIAAIGLRDVNGDPLPPGGLGNVLIGNVTVSTGGGNDLVAAHDTTFGATVNNKTVGGKITITLGAGDDRLAESENTYNLGALNAIKASRAGGGFDELASELSPIGGFALKFLQFEKELFFGTDDAEIQDIIDDIFASVNTRFGAILLDYGIDIGGGGGGGGGDDDDQISEAIALGDVTTPAVVDGIIDVGTDVDMHSFSVSDGQTVQFSLASTDATFDGLLRVFDDQGNEIASSDNAASGFTDTLSVTFPVGGTFFVGVSGSGNSLYEADTGNGDSPGVTGNYELTVGVVPDDPDDQISEANILGDASTSPTQIGTLLPGSDVDMYSFTVAGGDNVHINVSTTAALLDIVIRLFDANGNELEFADNQSAGFDETIDHAFANAGTFFVGISSFPNDHGYNPIDGTGDVDGDETGDYTISVGLI